MTSGTFAFVLLSLAAMAGEVADKPEGFGAGAMGGEGGRILTVTSLADDGPGSLRDALRAGGPRVIRFAVEGVIELQSRVRATEGRVTIDGASAPGRGITLRNHGIQFIGDCDDIVVRHLRISVTTGGSEGDALLFWGKDGGIVERVLVDHCSLMGATDEVFNTWGEVRDLTCQWTLLAEARLPHSKGWLSGAGSDRIAIHHCLFANNADRNPKLEGGVYDFVNNVVYNWGQNNAAKVTSGARVNGINNFFRAGPDSAASKGCLFPDRHEMGTRLFVAGNVSSLTPTGDEDPWLAVTTYEMAGGKWIERRPAPGIFRAPRKFDTPEIATETALQAFESVLAKVGPKVRDEDDVRIIQEVRDGAGKVGGPQK